jgi:predicted enzyme related to lactoylglutathione lyase
MSSDPAAAIAFYGDVFGWTADEPNPELGGYTNFRKDGETVAGLMQSSPDMGGPPNVWSAYLAVADAAATVAAAEANGGTVMAPTMAVGDLGTMAVIVDPGGAVIGMWQPGEHKGGVVAETGALCHTELHTRSYDEVIPFYEKTFGWTLDRSNESPEFRYAVAEYGPGENAGIMDDAAVGMPEGPSYWAVYFASDDVPKTLEVIREAGGQVVMGPDETPYGVLAVASDPNGALFSLRGGDTPS